MLRNFSGSGPDISRRRRRELWCSVPGIIFLKSVTPANEGLSYQAQIGYWKIGKESRSPFQDLRKKLSEGEVCCTPVG